MWKFWETCKKLVPHEKIRVLLSFASSHYDEKVLLTKRFVLLMVLGVFLSLFLQKMLVLVWGYNHMGIIYSKMYTKPPVGLTDLTVPLLNPHNKLNELGIARLTKRPTQTLWRHNKLDIPLKIRFYVFETHSHLYWTNTFSRYTFLK